MITLIDTDALLGIVNPNDALHTRAKRVAQELEKQNYTIYVLPTTLCEFATIATIRIGFEPAKHALERITRQGFLPVDATVDMLQSAIELYHRQTSKENSLTDCFIMIAAHDTSANCIFSFDKGYTQNGFTLAEDLLQVVQP